MPAQAAERPGACQAAIAADHRLAVSEIVGQNRESHLGDHFWKRFGEEVRRSHAGLHRAERMFESLSPLAHRLWVCVEALLHSFEQMLVLSTPPLHLRLCEVLVSIVHGFELAAVDGNARGREKANLTAELDKACTDVAKRHPVVLAEVRNRLVIGSEPIQQPHHLDIAAGLSFEPAARLHPVQIAVDVKFEQNRGMA